MSQTLRQSNLFVGQDWTVIYQAFSQVNFAAYDFNTIRSALVDYIRTNYPEDFNDWIESSEFVAIIEMLAYLASSLAFRIDLNTRENFLDTATRRESIFRLARFLSYNPRRCLAGQGLVKLTQVRTNQTIYDSNGINLANLTINWNDANNPDWLEQFVLVLNAAFQPANPFGTPVKSGRVGNVQAERYDFNNTASQNLTYSFNAVVNGTNMNFEFCNADFVVENGGSISTSSSGYFQEKNPNIFNSWSLVYRNDGNGNASSNTGFFAMFKQGTLAFTDYLLNTPIPNRVIDIDATNVNQSDVWVQTVDDSGIPLVDWTKVPAIFNSNLVYNNLDRLTRDIFQVVTRDQNGIDSISIRFGDGNFGTIPTGRVRVYYRTSNNLTYTIQPQDISSQTLNLSYQSQLGSLNTINMQFSLTYPVANSLSRESNDSISQRAQAVYYSQNRMVNGEDYNVFPLQNSQALKLKAVNRVYSGQSRYLDINDPTGSYANVKVFSDDGILYQEINNQYLEIPPSNNLNTNQIIESRLQPLLNGSSDVSNVNQGLLNFYLANFPRVPGQNTVWKTSGNNIPSSSQGSFVRSNVPVNLPDSAGGFTVNSMVLFNNNQWVTVVNNASTQLGNFATILSHSVNNNQSVAQVIPGLRVTLTDNEKTAIANLINSRKNFGLRYDTASFSWKVIDTLDLAANADFSLSNQGNTSKSNLDASWLVQMIYSASSGWQVTMRSLDYVMSSVQDVRFYFVNTLPVIDSVTGSSQRDNIRILQYNTGSNGQQLNQDIKWNVQAQQVYPDGYVEPSQIKVGFWDDNNDNLLDNPNSFDQIVPKDSLVFWTLSRQQGLDRWVPYQVSAVYNNIGELPALTTVTLPPASVVYVKNPGVFLQLQTNPASWIDVSVNYKARRGRSNLNYCWQHYSGSERRIDPAIMNIIDMYVLTNSYDTAMRNWISRGRPTDPEPQPPTVEDLRATFAEFNSYKMMTDQLVWHPIRYKLLFGNQADPELRAIFKVVKIPNSNITDSEIKSRVIQAIDNYFSVVNWEFGQSFFFTELAAYIHQQMPTLLASVVIVPANANSQFGDLFEITSDPDQLFLSAARVTDVQIVSNLNPSELRTA